MIPDLDDAPDPLPTPPCCCADDWRAMWRCALHGGLYPEEGEGAPPHDGDYLLGGPRDGEDCDGHRDFLEDRAEEDRAFAFHFERNCSRWGDEHREIVPNHLQWCFRSGWGEKGGDCAGLDAEAGR